MSEHDGKTREETLALQNEQLNFALETAGVGFWDWDMPRNRFYYSPAMFTMLGYKPDEFDSTFEVWGQMLHPDDAESAQKALADYASGDAEVYSVEYRTKHHDGGWAWIESRGTIVERDDDGKPIRMIGTHVNVTTRYVEQEARRKAEERAALALDTANAGYWDVDLVNDTLYLSPPFYRILGYEVDEFEASAESWSGLLHPDDLEAATTGFQELTSGTIDSQVIEFRMRKKDGTYLWMESRGMVVDRAEDGKPVRVLGVQIDINDRKLSMDTMRMLEAAIESATMGIAIFDLEGKATIVNDAFYGVLGYDAEAKELIGATVTHSVTEEGAQIMQNEILPAIMSKQGWSGEMQLFRKDGELIDVDSAFAPVLDDKGNVVAISGMASDITEQKEMEAVLIEQNQAMMEMSTPVITLWDEIVLLPLVGTIDDDRAMQMTERLLEAIVSFEARVAILDVTGVAVIDTSVARNLLKAVDAASMLGARVVVTGFSPSAAQTLAQLGVDFSSLMTQGSLRAGIAQAFALVGHKVTAMGNGKARARK